MKKIFFGMIFLTIAVILYSVDKQRESLQKPTPRQNFDQKYEATFGEKPSNEVWKLGLNPDCMNGCGGRCGGCNCKANL